MRNNELDCIEIWRNKAMLTLPTGRYEHEIYADFVGVDKTVAWCRQVMKPKRCQA